MDTTKRWRPAMSLRACLVLLPMAAFLFVPLAVAQEPTGTLVVHLNDEQGGAVAGATIRLTSPALLGGPRKTLTDGRGPWIVTGLLPGPYTLDIEVQGRQLQPEQVLIRAGETSVSRRLEARVDVSAATAMSDATAAERAYHMSPGLIGNTPRLGSVNDLVKTAPFSSPTSASTYSTRHSDSGSGTNENHFSVAGINVTCSCNGDLRSEPAVGFIQEARIQSVGASAEFGNMQGAVVQFITQSGGDRFQSTTTLYWQGSGLTSQPVTLPYIGSGAAQSGYERDHYVDVTTTLGGPVVRERIWFFGGYQYVGDTDSQPGTDPAFPRRYEMEKFFGKLTWRPSQSLRLVHSVHYEVGYNPDRPTIATEYEATTRPRITSPAITFGDLTHTISADTVWEARLGRYEQTRDEGPVTGDRTTPSVFDRFTGITYDAPPRIGSVTITRLTGKAIGSHYRPDLFGADHSVRFGVQLERGEHQAINIIPTNQRFEQINGQPLQVISSLPSNIGGVSHTYSLFITDRLTIRDWVTVDAGVRYDHGEAISQDLHAVDSEGRELDEIVGGLGRLYTQNLWAPRLGVTIRFNERTTFRANAGRYYQGILTGELESVSPGATSVTTTPFDPATGGYTGVPRTVDPKVNLRVDPDTKSPRTDQYSISMDRAIGQRLLASIMFIHKNGRHSVGWTETAGVYDEGTETLADGTIITVYRLNTAVTPPAARRFLITNPPTYATTYNGLMMALEKRFSHGWQASGSYTWSKAFGLLSSSGTSAAGAQLSTISPPQPLLFGRDPNDMTNATGLLANHRPHMIKFLGSADVPRTGVTVTTNVQYYTGKPYTAFALVTLPQGDQRIMVEERGSRRVSSQTLVDVRVSRPIRFGRARVELFMDLLNLLNDGAEESLITETRLTRTTVNTTTFAQPASFVDPRRMMIGVKFNFAQ